jgi:uncharacterized protein
MRTVEHIRDFIASFICWASTQPDIQAVALVGSYARNMATESSDIDLVLLTTHPNRYLENTDWLETFGSMETQQMEVYGKLTSLRVRYVSGHEVEYGLTTPDWVAQPLDAGTERVIQDGMKVLFERDALLSPYAKIGSELI